MAEKLLLHLQYECQRAKIELPWNSIAHRLHPGSSGAAITQHLTRLRRELVAEGHLVPPLPQSRGPVDSGIRGYVREDIDGSDKTTTRPVSFSETLEDRRFCLPDAFDDSGPTHSTDGFSLCNEGDDDPFVDSPTPIQSLPVASRSSRHAFVDTVSSFEGDEHDGFDHHQFRGSELGGQHTGTYTKVSTVDRHSLGRSNMKRTNLMNQTFLQPLERIEMLPSTSICAPLNSQLQTTLGRQAHRSSPGLTVTPYHVILRCHILPLLAGTHIPIYQYRPIRCTRSRSTHGRWFRYTLLPGLLNPTCLQAHQWLPQRSTRNNQVGLLSLPLTISSA